MHSQVRSLMSIPHFKIWLSSIFTVTLDVNSNIYRLLLWCSRRFMIISGEGNRITDALDELLTQAWK
ncbi:hypothetical protein OYT1_ch1449 [Ferriphaselus amnicola]|uniref:Uncharacterized protein n=1 Tax=Ferriphaselus amnicola TaxID=1188319 RepID=A0A2Z6GBS9_9PROT|nr:hypothetical protein OYT1_ch1449 [Ferriphaselus amnicola]